MLLFPLLDKSNRERLHACYQNFVTKFVIPLLHSIALSQNIFQTTSGDEASSSITYRFQQFPCIRIVRPGEFSIGPHSDIAYGHSIGKDVVSSVLFCLSHAPNLCSPCIPQHFTFHFREHQFSHPVDTFVWNKCALYRESSRKRRLAPTPFEESGTRLCIRRCSMSALCS